jgi:outer membrane protein OmpA-like peptidoglycan-associated protein
MDTALNKTEHVIHCVVGDRQCTTNAQAAGQTVVLTDAQGQNLPAAQQPTAAASAAVSQTAPASTGSSADASAGTQTAAAPPPPPGQGLWLNYDFIPGDRTIYFEDFSSDPVGDFPRRMELMNGNLEVVEYQGKRYLHSDDGGYVKFQLPEVLPERFTVEVHLIQPVAGNPLKISFDGFGEGAVLNCSTNGGGVYGGFEKPDSHMGYEQPEPLKPVDCRFTIDGSRAKGYINEKRVANLPNANVKRGNIITVQIPSGWDKDNPVMVTDIRIAAGGKKLFDALTANGRVATQGILFDTGKDQIRPESTPTLKEIGDMLKEHPELKLTIEGHTDNVGAAAANQDLSDRRAAAVKQYIVSTYGIDAARLQSKGFGATKPVGPNDTAEGRQKNRRVELVKM